MKPYDEQIKVWAASKYDRDLSSIDRVVLDTEFKEGYACCGGRDPECYCSFAESASMELHVHVLAEGQRKSFETTVDIIDLKYGDMNSLVKEIFEAEI